MTARVASMAAAPASTRWPTTNLASERTSFVGRERDLRALEELVDRGETLVTLLGPGGAGKTRLATRFGARLLARPIAPLRSVWFCDLSEARSRGELLAAVSTTLDIPLVNSTEATASEQIARALSNRRPMLLILDNFEQLVEDGAAIVGQWRAKTSGVVFLVTSRVRLRLEGETQVDVGPLPEADALALFEERARLVAPGFRTSQDETATRELVMRLDNSPLAIELAAARVKVLPPGKLLGRLAARLDLLRSGNRDALPRHATLRSALDGSWELLEEWERRSLAQCSVFHGGFTLEAAEAVIQVAPSTGTPPVVDVLEALVEKSLLLREDPLPDGDVRFRLFETVRDYAAEKLAEAGAAAQSDAERRHADHYLAEAEARLSATLAPWAAVAERRTARELDNLLAVVRRMDGRDPLTLVRAVLCVDAVLHARGPADTHRRVLERGLAAMADEAISSDLRARLLATSADAHRVYGDLAAAYAHVARAAAAAQGAGPAAAALTDVVLAEIELDKGRLPEARAVATRALDAARTAADPKVELVALHMLVRALTDADALTEARQRCDEALPIARSLGLPLVESRIEKFLGVIEARVAHLETAEAHYGTSAALARELGDSYLEAAATINLADVQARRGDHEGALARLADVLELSTGAGFRRVEAVSRSHIGLIEHDRGRLEIARASHAAGIAIHREMGNVRSEAFGLEASALLALEEGRLDDATVMLDRSLEIARTSGLGAVTAASNACLASVWAARGDLERAREALGRAHEAARTVARPEPTGLVALHEARTWVAEALLARAKADEHVARKKLAAAQAVDAAAADVAAHSARCRIARRLLQRALASAGALSAPAPTPSTEPLSVGEDGRWFRRPEGEVVDLSTRRALRLLLVRLASSRLQSPGEALTLEQLFEAGWPGERIAQTAAFRRVYTAIGTLRDLGLRDLLIRRDDGYLLSPEVPLRLLAKPPFEKL